MAGIEFGIGEPDEYPPIRDGVDFTHRLEKWKKENNLTGDDIPPIWVETEDGLVQQVTPENTRIYINEISDEHDNVAVLDPRDGLWITIYREKFYEPDFDEFVSIIGHAALTLYTMLPLETVVRQYNKEQTLDLDENFEIPDEWEK